MTLHQEIFKALAQSRLWLQFAKESRQYGATDKLYQSDMKLAKAHLAEAWALIRIAKREAA